jgi:hypothetical protein
VNELVQGIASGVQGIVAATTQQRPIPPRLQQQRRFIQDENVNGFL